MKKENETKVQQKRRFLLVLPLLLVPFVTIGFSFVKDDSAGPVQPVKPDKVLKTDLPGAMMKDEQLDKMSYYDLAKADSAKRQEMIKKDPYYQQELQLAGAVQGIPAGLSGMQQYSNSRFPGNMGGQPGMNTSVYGGTGYTDPHEAMVYSKINSLNAALNQNQQVNAQQGTGGSMGHGNVSQASGNEDIDRLEKMMKMMTGNEGSGQDLEIDQLNGMLEKLLDIQHPERVQEKLRKTSTQKKGQVFTVSSGAPEDMVSVLQQQSSKNRKNSSAVNGFYALDEERQTEQANSDIRAVVHETQVVTDGSVVKMRLLNDVFINGTLIPKDNFVFGTAGLSGERLSISVENIRFGSSIFPVKLSVYDMDGLDGIHIPGAISRDVAKQSGSNALQGLGMTSLDPSLGMQAASAGIELTKNLIGKKVKLVKVTIKAGYQVLFKDENQKDI